MNKGELLEILRDIEEHTHPVMATHAKTYAVVVIMLLRYIDDTEIRKAVGNVFGVITEDE